MTRATQSLEALPDDCFTLVRQASEQVGANPDRQLGYPTIHFDAAPTKGGVLDHNGIRGVNKASRKLMGGQPQPPQPTP